MQYLYIAIFVALFGVVVYFVMRHTRRNNRWVPHHVAALRDSIIQTVPRHARQIVRDYSEHLSMSPVAILNPSTSTLYVQPHLNSPVAEFSKEDVTNQVGTAINNLVRARAAYSVENYDEARRWVCLASNNLTTAQQYINHRNALARAQNEVAAQFQQPQ